MPEKFGLLSRVNIPCRTRLRLLIYSASVPPQPPFLKSSSKVTFSLDGGGAGSIQKGLGSVGGGCPPAHLFGEIFECQVQMHRDRALGSDSHACHRWAR